MAEISSEKSEIRFTAEAVRAEMQRHIGAIAALAPEDSRKAALAFVARVLRLPVGRVKCLFYGKLAGSMHTRPTRCGPTSRQLNSSSIQGRLMKSSGLSLWRLIRVWLAYLHARWSRMKFRRLLKRQ